MARTKRERALARQRRALSVALERDASRRRNARDREADDPLRLVREARSRVVPAPKGDLLHPIYGHPSGIAIEAGAVDWDEARTLWQLWTALDQVHAQFCARAIEVDREPVGSRWDVRHGAQSGEGRRFDLRTDEEKALAADREWRRLAGRLATLDAATRDAVIGSITGRLEMVRDRRVTTAGAPLAEGLRRLAKIEVGEVQ